MNVIAFEQFVIHCGMNSRAMTVDMAVATSLLEQQHLRSCSQAVNMMKFRLFLYRLIVRKIHKQFLYKKTI